MNLADIIAAHSRKGTRGMGVACAGCNWTSDATAANKTHVQIHAAHVAAEIEKARTVTLIKELDELPVDTVVLEGEPVNTVLRKHQSGGWIAIGMEQVWKGPALPARILWLPTDEATS